MRGILLLIWLVLASVANAQLQVVSRNASQLIGLEATEQIGSATFVASDAELTIAPVVLVEALTEAANVVFDASDAQRVPVEFEQLTPKIVAIRAPGKTWVDVTVLDFERNIYARKMVIVELGPGPPVPPEPIPPGPDEPDVPVPPEPGPFDSLSLRIAQQVVSMSTGDRMKIANACTYVAEQMASFKYRTVAEARDYLEKNWPKGEEPAKLLDFLTDDGKGRVLGWQQAVEYYRAIAKGVQ